MKKLCDMFRSVISINRHGDMPANGRVYRQLYMHSIRSRTIRSNGIDLTPLTALSTPKSLRSLTEYAKIRPHDDRVLDKFFHTINQTVAIASPYKSRPTHRPSVWTIGLEW